jgi:hypothetical protein
VLNYLDVKDLLSLRQVCKGTKYLVEQKCRPILAGKLADDSFHRIKIKTETNEDGDRTLMLERFLLEMEFTALPLSKFDVLVEMDAENWRDDLVIRFFQSFGPSLKKSQLTFSMTDEHRYLLFQLYNDVLFRELLAIVDRPQNLEIFVRILHVPDPFLGLGLVPEE